MTIIGWIQVVLFIVVLMILVRPLGTYIYRVVENQPVILGRLFGPLETITYRFCGVNSSAEMSWSKYASSLLIFSFVGVLFTYILLRLQGCLPLNPMKLSTAEAPAFAATLTPDLAFNTAVSFTTNTNWQAYAGEATMSYLSQMIALALHNWLSAAVGIAVAVALVRGFARHSSGTIGNFWQDITRILLYVLLPISFVYSLFLIWQGVVQNFCPYIEALTLEGNRQLIAQGPVASQEAIKMLGTNGGGFFNANSAHPFENPTPFTNFIEILSIFLIPAALTHTFGLMVKDVRQGRALLITMLVLFIAGFSCCYYFESAGNPLMAQLGVNQATTILGDSGGNMEGKEVRFGLANSALFATVTTAASCGAVNSMHDSFTPIAGLIPLLNIQLGEIVFGGVGAGLYGMLVFAVLTVFIAGLMVGRTPEYLGKKIEKKEVKMAILFVLVAASSILIFTALACVLDLSIGSYWNAPGATYANINNAGPHGLTEILYAFSSATGNNGSAFAGINVNTPFYNTCLGIAMLAGRFFMIVPILALAGSLAAKKYTPPSAGTFPTDGGLFITLLLGVILIVGALTFFPALTLGPIVEHFLMHAGRMF